MNIRLSLIFFALGFIYIPPAFSSCSGDQIEKMVDAGFSKQEIRNLCGGSGGGKGRRPVDNGDEAGSNGSGEGSSNSMSTTCRYTMGPKSGQTEYFDPRTPGLRPAMVGQPCTDGMGSYGSAVPNK